MQLHLLPSNLVHKSMADHLSFAQVVVEGSSIVREVRKEDLPIGLNAIISTKFHFVPGSLRLDEMGWR
jgi:hypothetical protein